jgi:hypothetical protein
MLHPAEVSFQTVPTVIIQIFAWARGASTDAPNLLSPMRLPGALLNE